MARQAGTKHAIDANASRSAATAANIDGSVAPTPIQQARHQSCQAHARQQPDDDAAGHDSHSLPDDQAQHVARPAAERHTDADVFRVLLDVIAPSRRRSRRSTASARRRRSPQPGSTAIAAAPATVRPVRRWSRRSRMARSDRARGRPAAARAARATDRRRSARRGSGSALPDRSACRRFPVRLVQSVVLHFADHADHRGPVARACSRRSRSRLPIAVLVREEPSGPGAIDHDDIEVRRPAVALVEAAGPHERSVRARGSTPARPRPTA